VREREIERERERERKKERKRKRERMRNRKRKRDREIKRKRRRETFEVATLSISDPTNLFDLSAVLEKLTQSIFVNGVWQSTAEDCNTTFRFFRQSRFKTK
jgi:hypothetical protein